MIKGSFFVSASALAAGLKPKAFAAGAVAASFAGSAGLNAPPNGFEVSVFGAGAADGAGLKGFPGSALEAPVFVAVAGLNGLGSLDCAGLNALLLAAWAERN